MLVLLGRLARSSADLPLRDVAAMSGWSAFHLHRAFRATVGETPRGFQLRLRLQRALGLLATTDLSIGEVAERTGFASHAGFTRSLRAAFGCTPSALRESLRGWTPDDVARMEATGLCVGLLGLGRNSRRTLMAIDIRTETLAPQPILFVRRRVAPSEIADTFAECLPAVFRHCQAHGLAMAGPPFARYPDVGRGMLTVECGIPLVEPAEGVGEIEAGELVGGPVAAAVHVGPYETLHETHAAVERWIETQGHATSGPPWESYVTDPAEVPDPAEWRTEIRWPLAR